MFSCACSPAARTTVTFTRGVVLERCVRHEQQTWTVQGREAGQAEVLGVLKELFAADRGRRSAGLPTRTRTLVDLRERPAAAPSPDPAASPWADHQLTELLNARGLQGTWAVA